LTVINGFLEALAILTGHIAERPAFLRPQVKQIDRITDCITGVQSTQEDEMEIGYVGTGDALHHVAKIRGMLLEVIQHARSDSNKLKEAKAEALLETTAEVLQGLVTACEHYETRSEKVWQV